MNCDKKARELCDQALQTYYNSDVTFVSDTLCNSTNVHNKLTVTDICNGVILFTIFTGMTAGSDGTVRLYQLLQRYLLDPEIRDEINSLM